MRWWSPVWPGSVLATMLLSTCPAAGAGSDPSPFELAAMQTVKLVVRSEGWVRVPQPDLLAAGLDAHVDPGMLRLFADGVEQAIQVTGNGDTTFDPTEAIEFYGIGRDTLWTDARTYWLAVGPSGLRAPLVANLGNIVSPPSFPFTARLRERKVYYAPLKNGDESNFFSAFVDGNGVTETLVLPHVHALDTAILRIVLQGVTTGTHKVAVALNGQPVGTCAFEGQTMDTCILRPSLVIEGDNQIVLVAKGAGSDYSLLDAVEVDYDHSYTADNDYLKLTAPPGIRLSITGFSSARVRVVDVTDVVHPVELVTGMSFDGSTHAVSVHTSGQTGTRTLLAFTDATVRQPSSVAVNTPSTWSDPRAGDLVILSHAQFVDSVRPLVERRTREGWSVQLVDLQDVYDEFGGGDKSAFAIRDFLRYAHDHWRVPPRFVLLVGDASFDPRNFLGLGDFDFAPTKLIDTQSIETASDDWFVDFNLDGVPDVAIGRLPVRSATEATTVIAKTLGYEGITNLSRGGLFVTDPGATGLDFGKASQEGIAAVSGVMPIDTFLLGQNGATPSTLIEKLNQGPFLVDYMGHGSVNAWNGLFSGDDAMSLNNQELSIYVAMNCLNGLFQDLHTESLAETLIKAPRGGAVAVWASSTLTSFDPQTVLNREFLKGLTRTSIGEAAIAAKQAITDIDARRTWILFGDPTLFGQPGTTTVDGAVDTTPTDAGDADGPAPTADAQPPSDGHSPDVDGSQDVDSKTSAQGGCGCQIDSTRSPIHLPAVAWGIWLLIAAGARRRRS